MNGQSLLGHTLVFVVAVLVLGLATAVPGEAQVSLPEPAPERVGNSGASLERVIGEVTAISPAAKEIGLKTDAGGRVTVILQDTTQVLRVPPGETDLKKAVKITPAEIGVGDRVLARGRLAEDQKSIPAVAVIVMTKADLAQTRERKRADWQKRAIAGTVSALNADTKEITLAVRSSAGTRSLVIEPSEKAVIHRYAADSVLLVQAKPSSFAELKVGDSLRILGDKNSDGTRVRPEEIVAGSFRSIPGIISAIDATAGEIRITDLQSKKLLTVRITADTMVRRLPPPTKAPAATNRPQAGGSGTAAGGRPNEGPTQGAQPAATTNRPPGSGSGTASGGRPSGGPTQGATSGGSQTDLERMPVVKFGELKRDEAIVVLCTVGAEPSRVTAIVVVAGIEPLLGQALQDQTQIGGAWNFFDITLP